MGRVRDEGETCFKVFLEINVKYVILKKFLQKSVEMYSENLDTWRLIEFKISIAIEAAPFWQTSAEEILVLGGRGSEGDSSRVQRFSLQELRKGEEWHGTMVDCGNIGFSRYAYNLYGYVLLKKFFLV